jgi:cytochrome P450
LSLFSDPRLSADRMKGFVYAVPEEARDDLGKIASFFEKWVLMEDEPDHAHLRRFLHLGFNPEATRVLIGQIQQAADELLDRVQDQGHMDASKDYGF